MFGWVLWAFVLALGAEGRQDPATEPPSMAPAPACVAGQQIACACLGGGQGVQRCRPDGSGYDGCACEPAPVPVPTGADSAGWVAPAPAHAPAPAPVAAPAVPQAAPAVGSSAAPPADRNRPVRTTLIVAGAATLGAGYILAVLGGAGAGITSAIARGSDGTDCGSSWAYSFLPLAGPAIAAATWPDYYKVYPNGNVAWCPRFTPAVNAIAAISTVAQIAGLGVLVTGIAIPKHKAGAARIDSRARWTVLPRTRPGYAGLSFELRLF